MVVVNPDNRSQFGFGFDSLVRFNLAQTGDFKDTHGVETHVAALSYFYGSVAGALFAGGHVKQVSFVDQSSSGAVGVEDAFFAVALAT